MYYERIYGFDNLNRAFKLARRGKRWKPATARFEVSLLENLLRLNRELQDKTYELSEYYTFKVYEPKERDINPINHGGVTLSEVIAIIL